MSATTVERRPVGPAAALESAAVALLCCAAFVGPLLLGGTWVWGRLGLEVAMALAIVLWAVSARRSPWLQIVPVVVVALVLVQIVPLPDRLLVRLSPVSAGAWKVALRGLPRAWGTISVDPAATAAGARRLLLGLATVMMVADLGRQPLVRHRLTLALAAGAAAIWAAGLAFPVDREARLLLGFVDLKGPIKFWKTPVEEPLQTSGFGHPDQVTAAGMTYEADGWAVGDGFGSYICSNHFAGGLCLTLPAALALWLSFTAGRASALVRFAAAGAVLAGAVWTVGGVAGSRAGAVAVAVAGLTLAGLSAPRRWQRRLAAAVAAAIAVATVAGLAALIVGGSVPKVERFVPKPLQPHVADLLTDGRIEATRLGLRMFRAAPLFGTGLGSFGALQPRFMPRPPRLFFAHDDYVQLVAETGLVGMVCAAALAWWLAGCLRTFLRRVPPEDRCLAAGPWAAVAAIGLHSFLDWNLHVPANGFLACLAIGLAAASGSSEAASAAVWPRRRSAIARILLASACVGAAILLARDATSTAACRRVSVAIAAARPRESGPPPATAADLLEAVADGQAAAARDRGNSRLPVLLGQAVLHLQGLQGAATPEGGPPAEADAWFRRARARAAATRGLGEPAVPQSPRR